MLGVTFGWQALREGCAEAPEDPSERVPKVDVSRRSSKTSL